MLYIDQVIGTVDGVSSSYVCSSLGLRRVSPPDRRTGGVNKEDKRHNVNNLHNDLLQ